MRRRFWALETVLVAGAALAGLAWHSKTVASGGAQDTPSVAHAKHWGYEDGPDSVGPEHWGELPGDEPCALGKHESPIALEASAAMPAAGPALSFDYHPARLSMIHNGHTVQDDYESGSSVSEGGVSYRLAQFHFHAPSEHTLDGKSFPMEIHLVHVNAAGKPALVVGVLVREGNASVALDTVFRSLPAHEGERSNPTSMVDAAALLPAGRSHFAYDGSLTTPPCTEGVLWRVMRETIELSAAQLDAFRSLPHLGRTNRPLQPIGARSVLLIGGP